MEEQSSSNLPFCMKKIINKSKEKEGRNILVQSKDARYIRRDI